MLRQRQPLRNGSLTRKPKVVLSETQIEQNYSNLSSPQDYCNQCISELVGEREKRSTQNLHSSLEEWITCFHYQITFLENFLQKIGSRYLERTDRPGSLYISWPPTGPHHKNYLRAAEHKLDTARNNLLILETDFKFGKKQQGSESRLFKRVSEIRIFLQDSHTACCITEVLSEGALTLQKSLGECSLRRVREAPLPDQVVKDSMQNIDWNLIPNKPSWPQYRRQWRDFSAYPPIAQEGEAPLGQGQQLAILTPSQDPSFQAFLKDVLKEEVLGPPLLPGLPLPPALPAPQALPAELPGLAREALPQEKDTPSKLARFTPNESIDEVTFVNSFFRVDSPPRAPFASISIQTTWLASNLSKTDFLRFQFGTLFVILATLGLVLAVAKVIKKVESFFKNLKKK